LCREKLQQRAPRNLFIFCVVAVLWFLLDRVTKLFFESFFSSGGAAFDLGGIIRISLVHNKGAAWGSFSEAFGLIIVVTLVLCAVIVFFALSSAKHASFFEMLCLALVFAGGIGNLCDRLFNGYVVDFIMPLFIDFPTFNIADVGITCGIVGVLICFVVRFIRESSADTHEHK
jgi:signal peptidase II